MLEFFEQALLDIHLNITGSILKNARKAKGYSYDKVCNLVEYLSLDELNKIENGERYPYGEQFYSLLLIYEDILSLDEYFFMMTSPFLINQKFSTAFKKKYTLSKNNNSFSLDH